MQLVEQGKIRLDDPINKHLPADLQIPDEGFSQPILVRNLMSHNAGFEDSVMGHIFPIDADKLTNQETYLVTHRVHRVRPPGQIAVYSNFGAGLAGMIVAHESGLDWPTYAEQHILRPLGMTTATYRDPYPDAVARAHQLAAPMPPEVAAHVTHGWKMEGGVLVPAPYEFVSHSASAGSLSMSPKDAARYMQALLDPDVMERAGVLRAATLREIREPLFANVPDPEQDIRHGFFTYDLGGGRWAYGHNGGLMSHFSQLEVSPGLGVGLFLSINTQSGLELIDSLPHAFFKEFYPLTEPPDVPRPKNAVAMAARYAGSYRLLRRAYFRTEGALMSLGVANVSAQANGDLLVGGIVGMPTHLRPVGDGIYKVVGGYGRMVVQERAGRMVMFDPYASGPLERVGYFESLNWFLLIVALGELAALWGVAAGVRRLVLGLETRPAFILDGLCLLWLASFVLLELSLLPVASDPIRVTYAYPGPLLPIACWLMLAAAIATPIAAAVVAFVARPKDWSWFRWSRVSAAVLIFVALALTLWQHGFLGFSDWSS
jgi:CubicO group peptidase (beta-lactamase class C family)